MEAFPCFQDDPSIPNTEFLLRTIHSDFIKQGCVSSGAFHSSTDRHVSVDRHSLSSPEQSLARRPKHVGVVQLLTGFVRGLGLAVASDPLPENPAHALIVEAAQSKKIAKQLATACTWALGPRNA